MTPAPATPSTFVEFTSNGLPVLIRRDAIAAVMPALGKCAVVLQNAPILEIHGMDYSAILAKLGHTPSAPPPPRLST